MIERLKDMIARWWPALRLRTILFGVLLFAALTDHQVEVVADDGIHARVDQSVWGDAAEALSQGLKRDDPAAGFEAAVGLCGEVLARHFPPHPGNPNEVADRLVVI